MATRSLSCPPSAAVDADGAVTLSEAPLSLDALLRRFESPRDGAVVSFQGVVRGSEDGAPIAAITYESYQGMARAELSRIVREARERWPVAAAVAHRVGRVAVAEASLVVVVRGAHRREAFEACQYVVDQIKARAAIWKVEYEWTGA